jgi:hypothetical protein
VGDYLIANKEMTAQAAKEGKKFAKRAQRFAMELPMRYRRKGTNAWYESTTVNVSASGVLFQAGLVLPPETAIDIALVLPVTIPGEAGAEIVCHGTVIRSVAAAKGTSRVAALAAAFQNYRFSRDEQGK